ncbi:hypothetical protein DFH07DRAFT_799569 [Mycena maculata]|uniref:Transmembrane protein n=1 Tax=Mycena maculata TaxID=230809 RepID=A0AAD7NUY1_9AGAR|nr:hypothetical protein DFH07DRAFT_799569 [Mycena maculata]
MILSPYLILFSGLWGSVFGLIVPGRLRAYSIASSHQDLMVQKNPGTDVETTTSTLQKGAAHPNRLTAVTIVIGVIGAIALVAAVSFGILLFMRRQRDQQRAHDSTSRAHNIEFPAATQSPVPPQSKYRPYYAHEHLLAHSPPQAPLRLDDMQSGWFLDKVKTPIRPTIARKTSRPRFDAEPNSTIPESPASTTNSSRARRSESESTPRGRSVTRSLPPSLPRPAHESERSPSPALFRRQTVTRKTSRPRFEAEQNSTIPEKVTPATTSSRTRRSESESTPRGRSDTRALPPQPAHESERSPSPALFRRQTVTRKTSRPRLEAEQNSTIPEKITPATTSSRTRRSESESTPRVRSDTSNPPAVEILFLPSFPPSRPSSPILLRQPDQSIAMLPRPRNASLPRSPPDPIIPPRPAAVAHRTSVSEDIRSATGSRFSISPVTPSFPSRLTLTSPTGHSFRSLNALTHTDRRIA